jgi:hypothetical protein
VITNGELGSKRPWLLKIRPINRHLPQTSEEYHETSQSE